MKVILLRIYSIAKFMKVSKFMTEKYQFFHFHHSTLISFLRIFPTIHLNIKSLQFSA